MRTKLLIGAVILVGAVTYLAIAGVQKGWVYYVHVDQFTDPASHVGQRVRLVGHVGAENLVVEPGKLRANFNLQGDVRTIPVTYHGVIPDMFKAGAEVVVEGRLDQAGLFHANLVMTKCASKYQEQPAGQSNTAATQP